MLDGGRYITDFMEPNPPLIMLLMAPPVILARLMHVEPYYVFALFVCLLIAASVLLVMPTLSWVFAGDPAGAQIALACYAAILSLHPAYQFGQRSIYSSSCSVPDCSGLLREAGRRVFVTSDWVAIVLASIAVLDQTLLSSSDRNSARVSSSFGIGPAGGDRRAGCSDGRGYTAVWRSNSICIP